MIKADEEGTLARQKALPKVLTGPTLAADPAFARACAGLAMTYVDDYRKQ